MQCLTKFRLSTLLCLALASSSCSPKLSTGGLHYTAVRSHFGYAAYDSLGVSAAAAGRLGDMLFYAGGANFPDKPASASGAKQLYNRAFLAYPQRDGSLPWVETSPLPEPMAYGLCLQAAADTLYLLGGQTPQGASRAVYTVTLRPGQKLLYQRQPDLPFTLDNAAGAADAENLYIVGGNQEGRPSSAVWRYDKRSPEQGWQRLPDLPEAGGYVQPVAALRGDTLWVSGGFSPGTAEQPAAVRSGLHYLVLGAAEPRWQSYRQPDAAANYHSGGTMAFVGNGLWGFGGVDRSVFTAALERIRLLGQASASLSTQQRQQLSAEQAAYLTHPIAWYHFVKKPSHFDPKQGKWLPVEYTDAKLARAGASLLQYSPTQIYLLQGELKPGVRSSDVLRIETKPKGRFVGL